MSVSRTNILITGVNGFVGPYLAKELLSRDCQITGLGYGEDTTNIVDDDRYSFISCNLLNEPEVESIDFRHVDTVIHLAGLASQTLSFSQPRRFIADNSAMLINICETVLKQKPRHMPRFVVISSGAVYDNSQTMPLTEESRLTYNSPYAISKILNENLCVYYRTRGITCAVVRPFNHSGPGQGEGFIIPDLVIQVQGANQNNNTILVGNLHTRRDYSDVRDIVRGYADIALAEKFEYGVYNLCRGEAYSGEEILHEIVQLLCKEPAGLTVCVDESRIRPNDPKEIYGDNALIRKCFGWEPRITLRQTIADYINSLGLKKN